MAALLSGSEVFMLIMAGISFLGACVGITYSFILRSRCTQISCCGASCTRDVLPADQSQLVTGVNQKNQTAVAQYNQHLLSSLQQYAPQYDAAVAQQNLQTAEQATTPTQLLQFNVQQSYQAQKQTYTPLSTQLPSGQSSGKA